VNKGFERATGEIVGWINSDDYYLPGALARAAAVFDASPEVDWVCGACRYLNSDGTRDTLWVPRLPRGPRAAWAYEPWYVPQASSFWRRSRLARVGLLREDLHYAMDVELGLRLAVSGVLPFILDQEFAVRAPHEAAKSAQPERWASELKRVRSDLEPIFSTRERLVGFSYRSIHRIGRVASELVTTTRGEASSTLSPFRGQ
jgi:GT2 family glycosyltransferase